MEGDVADNGGHRIMTFARLLDQLGSLLLWLLVVLLVSVPAIVLLASCGDNGGQSGPEYVGEWVYSDSATDISCTVTVSEEAGSYAAHFAFETPDGPWSMDFKNGDFEDEEIHFGSLGHDDPYCSISEGAGDQIWCYLLQDDDEISFFADRQ